MKLATITAMAVLLSAGYAFAGAGSSGSRGLADRFTFRSSERSLG